MVLKGGGDDDGADDDQLARRSVSRLWWGTSGMRRQVFEKSMQLDDRKTTKLASGAWHSWTDSPELYIFSRP